MLVHEIAEPRDLTRPRVHARGDVGQAVGPVVHGVHRGHHRQQHLRRADVRRCLLAADVLLARLQRQPVSVLTVGIDRHADQPPRQRTL